MIHEVGRKRLLNRPSRLRKVSRGEPVVFALPPQGSPQISRQEAWRSESSSLSGPGGSMLVADGVGTGQDVQNPLTADQGKTFPLYVEGRNVP
jgi:hypothetical protein